MAEEKLPNLPHFWEHFLGAEMEALAAYVFKYQGFNKDKDDKSQCLSGKFYRDIQCERPWQPIERLRYGLRFLATKPGKKFSFLNCKWNESADRLELEGKVSPKEVSKAYEAYNNVIKWNTEALEGYAEKHGPLLEKVFGFEPQEQAPFTKPNEATMFSMDDSEPEEAETEAKPKRKYTRKSTVEPELVVPE